MQGQTLGQFEDKFHKLLVWPGHLDVRAASCCLLLESTTQFPPDGTCVVMKNTPTLSIYEEEHKYLPDNKFGRL